MRPSAAGPIEAPLSQPSSAVSRVFLCLMPPTLMMFLAHACGRESWLPALDWDWVMAMSRRQMMSSSGCGTLV